MLLGTGHTGVTITMAIVCHAFCGDLSGFSARETERAHLIVCATGFAKKGDGVCVCARTEM